MKLLVIRLLQNKFITRIRIRKVVGKKMLASRTNRYVSLIFSMQGDLWGSGVYQNTLCIKLCLPFLLAWKLSSLGTYCMSYTIDVCGSNVLSLLILYTAYLNANSVVLPLWSSVNIAPKNLWPVSSIFLLYFFNTC